MGKASGEQVRYRNIIGSDECGKWWWELPFVRLLLLLGWQREDVEEEPSDREEGRERERVSFLDFFPSLSTSFDAFEQRGKYGREGLIMPKDGEIIR